MRHDTRGYGSQLEIDSSASYMFASQGLELDLGEPEKETVETLEQPLTAYVELGSSSFDSPIASIESSDGGLTVCLDVTGHRMQIARALLSDSPAAIMLLGEQFNVQFFKLEFNRAYLSIPR
jgi:hypothetical protein